MQGAESNGRRMVADFPRYHAPEVPSFGRHSRDPRLPARPGPVPIPSTSPTLAAPRIEPRDTRNVTAVAAAAAPRRTISCAAPEHASAAPVHVPTELRGDVERACVPQPDTVVPEARPRRVPVVHVAAGLGIVVALAAWLASRASTDVSAWGALATGLTTGGLSCLAVQGGLLASAVAGQPGRKGAPPAATIGWFLAAKVVTYTAFGALLGYFGSVVQMSFATRGWMQVGIGVFMLATALRMVWPHPWLRFLALEPPASVRRMIRRLARDNDSAATPVFLGALTVLIPCGVTQAMMVLALGSGNPAAGAVIMFMFTLGTVPLFFALSLAATKLGGRAQRQFNIVVAILIAVIAVLAIRGGMTLTGHHLGASDGAAAATQTTQKGDSQMIEIVAGTDGYAPSNVEATAGAPVTLVFSATDTKACTATLAIPALKIERTLTAAGPTSIEIPAQAAGTTIGWTCGMGMYRGSVTFTKPDASRIAAPVAAPATSRPRPTAASAPAVLRIGVGADGYSPSSSTAPANRQLTLILTTVDNASCTRTFVVPALGLERTLPASGQARITIPAQPAGRRITFTCGMGMYSGQITFAKAERRAT